MTQPTLLDDISRRERPWKRQRDTARAVYAAQREQDTAKAEQGQETRQGAILRLVAAYWNRHQQSPTALELLEWAKDRGERLFDINSLRPRLTELTLRGLIESAGKRHCHVSGKKVHAWRVVQR